MSFLTDENVDLTCIPCDKPIKEEANKLRKSATTAYLGAVLPKMTTDQEK